MSHSDYGWGTWAPDILASGRLVRAGRVFNEAARSASVAKQVAEERAAYPGWLLWLILPALLFPARWLLAGLIVAVWVALKVIAAQRAEARLQELNAQTARLKVEVAEENRVFKEAVLARANSGHPEAAAELLRRWVELLPESVSGFRVGMKSGDGGAWLFGGRAHPRSAIPDRIPRIGSRGRTVHDRRKAAEIDEDLTELNAAAVLSLLLAVLGEAPQRIHVVIQLVPDEGGPPVDWIALDGLYSAADVESAYRATEVPSSAIQAMGGTVGRIRSKKIRPAAAPSFRGPGERLTPFRMTDPQDDLYGRRAVTIGEPERTASSGDRRIPAPPVGFTISVSMVGGAGSRGGFLKAARENAGKRGSPGVPFVPFMTYWPTYSAMDAQQLRYYFHWRDGFRRGELLQADLSYLFVHVYELLHQVGVQNAAHAASELERLWVAYRAPFPKLDRYLVGWIADFYALHGSQQEVLSWYARAQKAGALIPDQELVADLYWAPANYSEMPNPVLAALIGGNPGGNKFYREHNQDGWIDRGYREAMAIADTAFNDAHGRTIRDATLERDGTRTISREPFASAVYELPKKAVVLGRVPVLKTDGIATTTFANVVRFSENLMRAERGFSARLRGVDLDAALARRLEEQFGLYLRRSRPKPKVTIDLSKAQHLARESAEVRAILLAGADETSDEAGITPISPPARETATGPARPSDAPAELLTDLASVAKALGYLPPPCVALVTAIADAGWEIEESADVMRSAAAGALVGPLIDSINEVARAALGDVLVVTEAGRLVLQDDYRDEVHYLLRGTLDGFLANPGTMPHGSPAVATPTEEDADTDGFGPAELDVLAVLLSNSRDSQAQLAAAAASVGTMPLILLDQINETALAGPYGDLIVDGSSSPPIILEDAAPYVRELLVRVGAGVPVHTS